MYAVIKTGGKQYRVAPEDVLTVEKVPGEAGDIVAFDEVLLVGGDAGVTLGSPLVGGASVAAAILEQERTRKIKVFKKKRRQGYRRTAGHRQQVTRIQITEILTDGQKPSAAAKAKAAQKKPAPKKAADEEAADDAPKAAAKPKAPAKPKASAKPKAKATPDTGDAN